MCPTPLFTILLGFVLALAHLCAGAVIANAGEARPAIRHHVVSAASKSYGQNHRLHPVRLIGYGHSIHPVLLQEPRPHMAPGHTFVPGKGILDAPCNLPTSACPNEMRDGG
jgi:hypothetical protein